MSATTPVIGVIGGSGLYAMDGIDNPVWRTVDSPWGKPSDQILHGRISGTAVRFLPRHGRGHLLSPSGINYRANVDALKRAGATAILSVSAVGSLHEDLPPGTFVIVDQFIDRTDGRPRSFFGDGLVAHVGLGHPVCDRLGDAVEASLAHLAIPHVRGGTYLAMEGPQFSTKAESALYRTWGCAVIGMTNMPEARLAREAELCYATVAMVTDYDCWHPGHDHVTVEQVVQVLSANASKAAALVRDVVPRLGTHEGACPKGCTHALEHALITVPDKRDPALVAKLDAVAGRVL